MTGLAVVSNFPKVTRKDWILSVAPKRADFADFRRSSAKNCEYLSSKFQCKNWPAILPLRNDMWSLAVVLPVWLWCVITQKWQKRTGSCQRRPNALILPIFGGWVRKIVNIFHQSFNAKTDQLSFLFAMICETWLWLNRFGCGSSFPKSGKRGLDFVNPNIYRFWPKNDHFVFCPG